MQLVDEDPRWDLSAGRTKLRQDIRSNVVVADDVMEFETMELVLELAYFKTLRVHVFSRNDPCSRLLISFYEHGGNTKRHPRCTFSFSKNATVTLWQYGTRDVSLDGMHTF